MNTIPNQSRENARFPVYYQAGFFINSRVPALLEIFPDKINLVALDSKSGQPIEMICTIPLHEIDIVKLRQARTSPSVIKTNDKRKYKFSFASGSKFVFSALVGALDSTIGNALDGYDANKAPHQIKEILDNLNVKTSGVW